MRNPDRIDIILNEIKEFWKENPDLRFHQMIHFLTPGMTSHYYLEDDDFLNYMRKEKANRKRKHS